MSCFLPTLPQTFIKEWHTHGNIPPCPSSGYFKVIVSFLKGIWNTGGCFYSPFDAHVELLPASMNLHRSTQSWHPPGLYFPKMPTGSWAALRSRKREVSLHPAPLLSTGEATPAALGFPVQTWWGCAGMGPWRAVKVMDRRGGSESWDWYPGQCT